VRAEYISHARPVASTRAPHDHDEKPPTIPIQNCAPVLVKANADDRGCLFEIFREEWVGAFKAVQWNACSSRSGVMRGVHVHIRAYSSAFSVFFGAACFRISFAPGIRSSIFDTIRLRE
jgi:hypothetical protein